MKKKFVLFLVSAVILLAGCTTDDRVTGGGATGSEERVIGNFTRINTYGSSHVKVRYGLNPKIELRGYTNLMPYYDTRIVNGSLELGYRAKTRIKNDNLEIWVTLPVLEGLAISGSADILAEGPFNSERIDATVSGSGDIEIKQSVTENFFANVSGSGNIDAYGLTADKALIEISGSGRVKTLVEDELIVRIAGSGDVYYKGSPAINSQISGSGSLVKE